MKNFVYVIALVILCSAILVSLYAASLLDAPARYACLGAAGMFASVVIGSLLLRLLLQERQPVDLSDPLATVTIPQSKSGSIATAAMLAGISGSLYLMAMSEALNATMIWIGFWFCTALAAISLLGARSASLRLSPSGLEYTPFRSGPISWSDIAGASVVELGGRFVVALHVTNMRKYPKRRVLINPLYLAERVVARTPFLIPANMLSLAPSLLVDAVSCRVRAFGTQTGSGQLSQTRIEPTLS